MSLPAVRSSRRERTRLWLLGSVSLVVISFLLASRTSSASAAGAPLFPRADVLAFSCSGCPDGRDSEGIFTIRSDGSGLKALARSSGDYEPRWSPSGQVLVVSRAFKEIWSLAADGSSTTRLIRPPRTEGGVSDTSPSWSPEGRRLVFVRLTEPLAGQGGSNRTALWTASSRGGGQRLLYAPRRAPGMP